MRTLSQTQPLRIPITTIGSGGGGFTNAAFSSVAGAEVTDTRLDGVGHYLAQEVPELLAHTLLEAFDDHTSRDGRATLLN